MSDDQIQLPGPDFGHGRCPRKIIRDKRISPQARWLWTCLEDYATDERPQPFPGHETLAEYAGCTPRTIHNWQSELVEAGWLYVDRRQDNGGRGNIYTLVWPGFEEQVEAHRKLISGGDRKPVSGGHRKPVSDEAEPGEAEPEEATTPSSPPRRTAADLFEEWWKITYGFKLGSKSRAKGKFKSLLREHGIDWINERTRSYHEARNRFSSLALARTGHAEVFPKPVHGVTLLNNLEDWEDTLDDEQIMAKWGPVLWELERANGRQRQAPVSARELARRADGGEG